MEGARLSPCQFEHIEEKISKCLLILYKPFSFYLTHGKTERLTLTKKIKSKASQNSSVRSRNPPPPHSHTHIYSHAFFNFRVVFIRTHNENVLTYIAMENELFLFLLFGA